MKYFLLIISIFFLFHIEYAQKGPKKKLPKSSQNAGKLKPKFNKASKKGTATKSFNQSPKKNLKSKYKSKSKQNLRTKFNSKTKTGKSKNYKPISKKRTGLKNNFNVKSRKGLATNRFNPKSKKRKQSSRRQKFNLSSRKGLYKTKFTKSSKNRVVRDLTKKPNSKGNYLSSNWHKGTFPNKTHSVKYHLAKHGKGRTASQYTRDAMKFFQKNKSKGENVILRDGSQGIKIRTTKIVNGKKIRIGGYWTKGGKLVTFWD